MFRSYYRICFVLTTEYVSLLFTGDVQVRVWYRAAGVLGTEPKTCMGHCWFHSSFASPGTI
jgi:hypothetical protein